MSSEYFYRKIARLESVNDYLESELSSLDQLLRSVGFEEGITSVKLASIEALYFFPEHPEPDQNIFPQNPTDYEFLEDIEN